jgi:hypothetical protein
VCISWNNKKSGLMLLIHGANMKKVTEQFERELDETGPSVK